MALANMLKVEESKKGGLPELQSEGNKEWLVERN